MTKRSGGFRGAKPTWTTTSTSGIFGMEDVVDLKAAGQWPRGPAAPTNLAATAGNAQVALTWTAPATTHGTIANYAVEYTPSGGSPTVVATGSTAASYTVTGLTNGTAYTFRVAAVNHTVGDYSSSVTVTPTAAPTDPHFASVSLLLQGSLVDQSSNAFSVTAFNVSPSNVQTKYSANSLFFDRGRLTLPSSDAFVIGTGQFTIEMWIYKTSTAANGFPAWSDGSNGVPALFYGDPASGGAAGGPAWYPDFLRPEPNYEPTISPVSQPPLGQWVHLALVRDAGGMARIYYDGVQVASASWGAYNVRRTLLIGSDSTNTFWARLSAAYVDGIRYTKGVCRYPDGTTFTPPTAAFPTSA